MSTFSAINKVVAARSPHPSGGDSGGSHPRPALGQAVGSAVVYVAEVVGGEFPVGPLDPQAVRCLPPRGRSFLCGTGQYGIQRGFTHVSSPAWLATLAGDPQHVMRAILRDVCEADPGRKWIERGESLATPGVYGVDPPGLPGGQLFLGKVVFGAVAYERPILPSFLGDDPVDPTIEMAPDLITAAKHGVVFSGDWDVVALRGARIQSRGTSGSGRAIRFACLRSRDAFAYPAMSDPPHSWDPLRDHVPAGPLLQQPPLPELDRKRSCAFLSHERAAHEKRPDVC